MVVCRMRQASESKVVDYGSIVVKHRVIGTDRSKHWGAKCSGGDRIVQIRLAVFRDVRFGLDEKASELCWCPKSKLRLDEFGGAKFR